MKKIVIILAVAVLSFAHSAHAITDVKDVIQDTKVLGAVTGTPIIVGVVIDDCRDMKSDYDMLLLLLSGDLDPLLRFENEQHLLTKYGVDTLEELRRFLESLLRDCE
jgi:hypothetical protein